MTLANDENQNYIKVKQVIISRMPGLELFYFIF